MEFDLVILGSGLVGGSLASALKNKNFKIAVIDKTPNTIEVKTDLDARALALSYTSVQCLNTIEVWSKISKQRFPIAKIHVSKKNHFGCTELSALEYGLPNLGFVVNADYLNKAINQSIEKRKNINIYRPDEIVSLNKDQAGWRIELRSQKVLSTQLLVAADGSESYLRKHLGIDSKITDYQQTAIVCNVELEQAQMGIAFERFTHNGSIAMLPFGENGVKCVWIVPNPEQMSLSSLSDNQFLSLVQKSFGFRLGNLIRIGNRITYPLRTVYSESIYGDRWVLIGNAANTLSPVAAQGFNLGLRDAAMLAEILVTAKQNREAINTITVLRKYAESRLADHNLICQGTGRMIEQSLLQWLGILASEWLPPFKRRMMGWGLGKQGYLPKLCRGIQL